jgi:hypothetical protein
MGDINLITVNWVDDIDPSNHNSAPDCKDYFPKRSDKAKFDTWYALYWCSLKTRTFAHNACQKLE